MSQLHWGHSQGILSSTVHLELLGLKQLYSLISSLTELDKRRMMPMGTRTVSERVYSLINLQPVNEGLEGVDL